MIGAQLPSPPCALNGSIGARKRGRQPRNWTAVEHIEKYSIPEPNSGCWLWLGHTDGFGYGKTMFGKRTYRAHRLSWEAHRGHPPGDRFVCHKCDVPACVNPDHLWLGTHDDNMRDMRAKGRHPFTDQRGEANPFSRLTEDIVRRVRAASGTCPDIAIRFGLNKWTVHDVRARRTWRHI